MINNPITTQRKVLIVVGSRHGSTAGIGKVIAATLRNDDVRVDYHNPDDLVHVADYDAVVLGSAIYDGTWLPEMMDFVIDYRLELLHMPVYLFSSGPVGAGTAMRGQAGIEVGEIVKLIRPKEHEVFHGSLARKSLTTIERLRATILNTPEGDERDWAAIIAWSRHIATEVKTIPAKTTAYYF